MSGNWSYYVAIAVCVTLSIVTLSTYATLVPKDSSENTKLLAITGTFSLAASIFAYAIALYHFSHNPTYMIQFILAIVLLVCLPAALFSMSISTITVSNLRDTLAAAGQA